MSRWLDHADALAAYLAATLEWCKAPTPEADRIPVLVDRKLEIASTIQQVTAKAKGAAIVILFTGAKNPDRKSTLLHSGASYTIFVMTRPLFTTGFVTGDDLAEATAEALHGWVPAATPNTVTQRLEVESIHLAPHGKLLIYEISAEIQRLKR